MKISALSAATGVPIATLKFYLREGLLHPGEVLSRTQASYDQTHVERVRMVRALSEVGGLSLSTIQRVLDALEITDLSQREVMNVAQRTLMGGEYVRLPRSDWEPEAPVAESQGRVGQWLAHRDWDVDPSTPVAEQLEAAWQALDDAQVTLTPESLDSYADAMEEVARIDVASVPEGDAPAALRRVVLGSVLVDQVLRILRLMAQMHTATHTAGLDERPAQQLPSRHSETA